MNNPFMKHPNAVGETYIEHMGNALKFSFTFLQLAVIAYIHAFFPFLFTNTGSDKVRELNDLMLKRREQEYHWHKMKNECYTSTYLFAGIAIGITIGLVIAHYLN